MINQLTARLDDQEFIVTISPILNWFSSHNTDYDFTFLLLLYSCVRPFSGIESIKSLLSQLETFHFLTCFHTMCFWVFSFSNVINNIKHLTNNVSSTFGFRPDPAAERLTYEQLRVASHRFRRGEVVRVIAYAGTGKTTTLVSCVRANPNLKFLYTSFGKYVGGCCDSWRGTAFDNGDLAWKVAISSLLFVSEMETGRVKVLRLAGQAD